MGNIDYTKLGGHQAGMLAPRPSRRRRYEKRYLLLLIAAAMLPGASTPTAISYWVEVNRAAVVAAMQAVGTSVPSMAMCVV